MDIREIEDAEIEPVIALWRRCGLTRPWNDPQADIVLARSGATSSVLVARQDNAIVATVMVGTDGHRGWVYYVAVEPDLQGHGLGRAMMAAAEQWAQDRGVPKIQLMVRATNARATGFYKALGYLAEDTIVMGKRFDGQSWTVAPDPAA